MGNGKSRPRSRTSSLGLDSTDGSARKSLHQGLVRERSGGKRETFEDIYEVLHEIGQGGLCKIYKIQKKGEKIGGSSRPENVKMKGIQQIIFNNFPNVPPSPRVRPKQIFSPVTGDFVHNNNNNMSTASQQPMYFALKVFNLVLLKEEKIESLRNEVEILKTLDHKNIIKAYEAFTTYKTRKLMLVMELCTGGDMYARIPYTEPQVAIAMRQVLSAVKYMHSMHFIHRDIKMENILWESPHPDAEIKLIDFGLTKEYSTPNSILTERVGTLYSMSPETMKGIYTQQADLWSVAVCAFIMLANGQDKPFEGRTPKEVVAKVLRGEYSFEENAWKDISDDAKDFINSMLVVEPTQRLTATEALSHPWIVKHHQERSKGSKMPEDFVDQVRQSIIAYADMGEFRKLALNVVAKKSSSKEILALRKVFEEFDTDNTGTITLDEFTAALSSSHYSDEEIKAIFRKVDVNQTDVINYTEFLAATLETQGAIEEYRLAEAFDALDSDDSGYISRENLRNILGSRSDEKLIDQLIAEADFRKDGRVSYEEFLQLFAQTKQEQIRAVYEAVAAEHAADDEILRRHGLLKGLRNNFSSTNMKRLASFGSTSGSKHGSDK